ncbi:MAG: membrane protein insertase YidC [Tetragenococcus koreensis]|nr:membrane protein insertase YidC [Tetragenococcus koreensis]
MNKIKKWLVTSGLLGMMITLSGCVKRLDDGSPDPSGLIYRFLVNPLGSFLTYMADNWDLGFGWAIIVLTIIIRCILMPLMINQSRKSMFQSEKMQYLKPQIDIAQKNMKQASTQAEQMQAQKEMQEVYKENNVSMLGGIGCLPLLIQMPIFSALFFTTRYTPGIESSTFLGMSLGERSLTLVVIAGLAYVAQSFISMIGMPPEQKKQMRSMMIVSPMMIVFVSLSSPAGVTLYWVVGGFIGCVQTFITNVLMKPRIKKQIAKEMEENPPKTVVTQRTDVTPSTESDQKPAAKPKSANTNKNRNRNAGKQQYHKN